MELESEFECFQILTVFLCESVDDAHGIACSLVMPSATMHVAENASQADMRSVYVVRTTVQQYFSWYRASRESLGDS